MAIDETPKDPARLRLEMIIEHCEKRASRAAAKLAAAQRENTEASAELETARADLAQWIAGHPDPQPTLI